jgi:hypothetical protein
VLRSGSGQLFIMSLVRAPVLLDEEQAKEIGRQLFNKLDRCGAPSELSNYVNETEEWKVKVTQELQSARPTETPLFTLLMLTQPLLGGVVDLVYMCIRQKCKAKADVPHQRIGRDHEETNLGVFGQTSDFLVSQPGQPGAAAVLR